jgi:hypothetical protein
VRVAQSRTSPGPLAGTIPLEPAISPASTEKSGLLHFFVPEDLPAPIGDDVDEVLSRLRPETTAEYGRLKREYREFCRDVRTRHRGAVREALLRQKAEEFEERVRELLARTIQREE